MRSYLGNEFTQEEIENELNFLGARYETLEYDELIDQTAEFLSKEKAVGWFQGRMNLGQEPWVEDLFLAIQDLKMQKNLNLKVKYRESFRPFAPSVLREDVKMV